MKLIKPMRCRSVFVVGVVIEKANDKMPKVSVKIPPKPLETQENEASSKAASRSDDDTGSS